jgi:hypothetical protein
MSGPCDPGNPCGAQAAVSPRSGAGRPARSGGKGPQTTTDKGPESLRQETVAGVEVHASLATPPGSFAPTRAEKPAVLRVSGSFGVAVAPDLGFVRVVVPLGFVRSARTLLSRPPEDFKCDWEFYPISADVTTSI